MAEQRDPVVLYNKDLKETATVPAGAAEVLKKSGWTEEVPKTALNRLPDDPPKEA